MEPGARDDDLIGIELCCVVFFFCTHHILRKKRGTSLMDERVSITVQSSTHTRLALDCLTLVSHFK